MTRILRCLGATTAVFAALLGIQPASAEDAPLRIGVITFLSGPAAGPFGVPARNAADLMIGARGPNGPFAPPTGLNKWFQKAFKERFNVAPVYASYHLATAFFGAKAAYEKAQATKGGWQAHADQYQVLPAQPDQAARWHQERRLDPLRLQA